MYKALVILLLFTYPLHAMEKGKRALGQLLSSYYNKNATREVEQPKPERAPEKESTEKPILIQPSPQQTAKIAVWQIGLWGAATVITTLLVQHALELVWYKHSSWLGIAADVAVAAGCGYAWAILGHAHMPMYDQTKLYPKLVPIYSAGIGGMATVMAFGNIICAPKGYTNPRLWGASVIAAPLMVGAVWHWNNKK